MQRVASSKEGRGLIVDFFNMNYGKGHVNANSFASVVTTMSNYVTEAGQIQKVSLSISILGVGNQV